VGVVGELELKTTRVIESPEVTHLRFHVTGRGSSRMAASKAPAKKAAGKKSAAGVDDRYFAEQSADKAALLEKLRALIKKEVPDAEVTIKWGVPFYQRNGKNVCSLAAFKEHVGINFFASPSVLVDPKKKLEGEGKSMRMLKVRTSSDIDSASILRWLKATVAANG
jgi:hypothetical protein